MKIKSSDIKRLIRLRYAAKRNFDAVEWIVVSEIRTNTGFMSKWRTRGGPFGEHYIDMMAFNCWPSKGFLRIAFEIKTSRSDFLDELKDQKSGGLLRCTHTSFTMWHQRE